MRLETLCNLAGLETPPTARMATPEITAITSDSRAVVPGCLFVCIRGARADGHAFIEEACSRGAAAVVIERNASVMEDCGAIFIRTDNTRAAMARLYDAWYGHPAAKLRLVAVTGTNGKTSVATMLKSMLDAAMIPAGLIGTVQCVCLDRVLDIRSSDPTANMTTPDPAELYHMLSVMADAGVKVVVMEATSHALALDKLAPLTFEAAVFTNLTPEHLDFHGTQEAYFEAKAKLFAKSNLAILNADDPVCDRLAARCAGRVVRTSCEQEGAEYWAETPVFEGAEGVRYTLCTAQRRIKIESPIPGLFTLSNTLQAAACALELGVLPSDIRQALASLGGVPGRMERVRVKGKTDISVFIDYAHTPDALENLLRTARGFCPPEGRVVVLFGCGGDRDKSKRPRMGEIATRMADVVYITSDNSRSERPEDIIGDILDGIDMAKASCVRVIKDRAAAIETAIALAEAGDIILLAGKGHETYELDATGKHPFSEKEIAQAAILRTRRRG